MTGGKAIVIPQESLGSRGSDSGEQQKFDSVDQGNWPMIEQGIHRGRGASRRLTLVLDKFQFELADALGYQPTTKGVESFCVLRLQTTLKCICSMRNAIRPNPMSLRIWRPPLRNWRLPWVA